MKYYKFENDNCRCIFRVDEQDTCSVRYTYLAYQFNNVYMNKWLSSYWSKDTMLARGAVLIEDDDDLMLELL